MDTGQTWWAQSEELVGDTVWGSLSPERQVACAELRGEHEFFSSCGADKLLCLAPFDDLQHFGCVMLTDSVITARELEVFEERFFTSNFHSCSAEAWNSTQPDFTAGAHMAKETSTAHYYEGNARQLMRKDVRLKRQEDLPHFDPSLAWKANRLAGHDPTSPLQRLTTHRPHKADRPAPVADGEICVQEIGSFAKRTGGGKRPHLTVEQQLRLPSIMARSAHCTQISSRWRSSGTASAVLLVGNRRSSRLNQVQVLWLKLLLR